MSNDFIAGRLKQFSHQWTLITSDQFILDSVSHYKIEFVAGFPQQEEKGNMFFYPGTTYNSK